MAAAHRWVSSSVLAPLVAVGVAVSATTLPGVVLVALVVCGGSCGAAVAAVVATLRLRPTVGVPAVLGGTAGAVGAVAVTGLVVLAGPVALVAVAALGVLGVLGVLWLRRLFLGEPAVPDDPLAGQHQGGAHAAAPGLTVEPAPTAVELAHVSDAHLRQLWTASGVALRRCRDATAVAAVIERRSLYLDELARRDPTGVARWVAAGTPDPTPYLRTTGPPPATP